MTEITLNNNWVQIEASRAIRIVTKNTALRWSEGEKPIENETTSNYVKANIPLYALSPIWVRSGNGKDMKIQIKEIIQ